MPEKRTNRTQGKGSTRVESAGLGSLLGWPAGTHEPVIVVVKAAGAPAQAACQVFGVDPRRQTVVFAAEGTAQGLLERLMPAPPRGMVLTIDVAQLLPFGPPTRHFGVPPRTEGPLPAEPPPVPQGGKKPKLPQV